MTSAEAPPAGGVRLTSVVREFIADTVTPIGAYLALATPGASCLLESVEGTDRIARYSFLGFDYLETLTIDRDPRMIARVRDLVRRYRVAGAERLPYGGGVVCAFSYDAARMLEPLLGRRPPSELETADAYVAVPGTWVVFDHFSDTVALIGFAREDESPERVGARLDAYVERLARTRPSFAGEVRAKGTVLATLDEGAYLARVAAAKRAIYEGDVYQLQLGVRFTCEVDGAPFDFYRRMRARNPSPYMFFLDVGERALFGASPEFLVRLEEGQARIRPLAGTRPRGETPQRDREIAAELLANVKERAEHVMLVDLGRNDLGAVCGVGSVRVDELLRIERYSHVMHIVSNVVGRLRPDRDALDLFAAAFPAGTVTGTPKIRAMQTIDALETQARGFYAGSIAKIDFDGDMDSCITLRSVTMSGKRAYWQASAGIVADSDPDAEYAEIFAKTRIVRETLGLPPR